jgi:hypothetical protein
MSVVSAASVKRWNSIHSREIEFFSTPPKKVAHWNAPQRDMFCMCSPGSKGTTAIAVVPFCSLLSFLRLRFHNVHFCHGHSAEIALLLESAKEYS